MKRPHKFRPIGWQLVGGIWHQVVQSMTYETSDGFTAVWRIEEKLLPEPNVTLTSAGSLMRESRGVFGYMRYW